MPEDLVTEVWRSYYDRHVEEIEHLRDLLWRCFNGEHHADKSLYDEIQKVLGVGRYA